jgi:hypothetical protein
VNGRVWHDWLLGSSAKELWDGVHAYVRACHGDPAKHVYGNTSRQMAAARIDDVIRPLVEQLAKANLTIRSMESSATALREMLSAESARLKEAEQTIERLSAVRAPRPMMDRCPRCFGGYEDPICGGDKCTTCNGTGMRSKEEIERELKEKNRCLACWGSGGDFIWTLCKSCNGTGQVTP